MDSLLEDNVKDFGGIQGDLEYIKFNRSNFGYSLTNAIDYILAVSSVKLTSRVEGNNIHITLGDPASPEETIAKLRTAKTDRPNDVGIRLALALPAKRAIRMQRLKNLSMQEPISSTAQTCITNLDIYIKAMAILARQSLFMKDHLS